MENVIGTRIRLARERAGLSQGQVSKYDRMAKSRISEIESGLGLPTAEALIRFAKRYSVSADYLLGLTDNPLPADVEVEEGAYELFEIWNELGPERRGEWIAHGRLLEEEERQADLREYDRLMALIAAAANGDMATDAAVTALRAHAAGDRAGAWQLIRAFVAGFAESKTAEESTEVKAAEENGQHV